MIFSDATAQVVDELQERLEKEINEASTLEKASQRLCALLYETFPESAVLVRVFVTVPFGRLPDRTRAFVRRLVTGTAGAPLDQGLPVLALLGTRGREPQWNDRHRSEGHLAIPLASAAFVEEIPMIASLMKQLGIAVGGKGLDTAIVTQSIGSVVGLFYVEDARTTVDGRGRRVITAQPFVEAYSVRTVFGFGGTYTARGTFMAAVVFTNERIGRRDAERFMRLANVFKAVTMRHVFRGQLFDWNA
jgi:hypothetical protein